MATPMTAAQVKSQLTRWGLKYVEIPGWSTHNRNSVGAWGGVNGFIWHHTGATITASSAKTYAAGTLYNGRSDLPGPLCHFSIGLDGTLFLVGWGRANHAGGGDPAVLQHVISEDYTGQLHPTKGNANGVDGNAHFYGVEIQYSGSHTMADAQYKTALRLSAALLEHHGWSEKSVIGHGEWSNDKWDPGYAPSKIMNMPDVRADVKKTLTAGPNQEDDMPLSADDIKKAGEAAWKADVIVASPPPYNNSDYATNKKWSAGYALSNAVLTARKVEAKVDDLAKKVDAISVAGVDLDALATKVADLLADLLAARLAK